MGRAPCCEKVGLNRGPWTREEDMRLTQYIQAHGGGCWRTLPKAAGLLRCGKSCRLRWINYLRPDLKRGNISEEEDRLIIKLHSILGNRWSLIAGRLPGRTDNEIKNYWNTHLKKKLRNMGIDPQTHSPLVVADTTRPFAKKLPSIDQLTYQPHASQTTPPRHLSSHLIPPSNHLSRPTNHQLLNADYQSSAASLKAKPLDRLPSPLNLVSPYLSSFLATNHPPTLTAKPLINPPSSNCDAKPSSSRFPLSLIPSSSSTERHPHFLPMLGYSQTKPRDTPLSNSSSLPNSSQSLCLPWIPSNLTSMGTTLCTSSPLSSSSSSSSTSSSSCALSSFIDAPPNYHSKNNICEGDSKDSKDVMVLTTTNGAKMEKFIKDERTSRQGSDVGLHNPKTVDEEEDLGLIKDYNLSLMEGELLWDMEMIHSFQEAGTPTTSSTLTTCSSSCNLWSHDISCCYNSSPLQTWLNVGNDQ